MAIDRGFFTVTPHDAGTIAEAAGASLHGTAGVVARDAAPLSEAVEGDLCFMNEDPGAETLARLSGAVVVTTEALLGLLPRDCAGLACPSPRLGFARAMGLMASEIDADSPPRVAAPVDGVLLGASVAIGANVVIGAGTIIGAGAVIHQGVEIGRNCRIGANAVLSHCRLSEAVHIGANSVVGGAGFGFEITADGPVALPHVGSVAIGAGSRTGAGCTIDRGTLGVTLIGTSVMIDNQVHIAHNCEIGDRAVLAAQVGLAGGAVIGEAAMLAGQAGVSSQVSIGKGAIVMGQSGVTKDVPDSTTVVGFPAEEAGKVWRERAALRRLSGASRKKEG